MKAPAGHALTPDAGGIFRQCECTTLIAKHPSDELVVHRRWREHLGHVQAESMQAHPAYGGQA